MTSPVSLPGGGTVGCDARDGSSTRCCADVVAESLERHRRGDHFRLLHELGVLAVTLRVGRPLRQERALRNQRCTVRASEREELLESSRAAYEDVHVVDVAVLRRLRALDPDSAVERLGLVGEKMKSLAGSVQRTKVATATAASRPTM